MARGRGKFKGRRQSRDRDRDRDRDVGRGRDGGTERGWQGSLAATRPGPHPLSKYADATPDLAALAEEYPSLRPYIRPYKRRRHAYRASRGRTEEEGREEDAEYEEEKGCGKGEEEGEEVLADEKEEEEEEEGSRERRRGVSYCWDDYNATRELTRVLLDHDFGVTWWIEDGTLCPPVTNRSNYIHWLQDLLALHPPPWLTRGAPGVHPTSGAAGENGTQALSQGTVQGPVQDSTQGGTVQGTVQTGDTGGAPEGGEVVVGLDIGTGASLIYPLLGAAICGWHFVGTDVTGTALRGAEANRAANPHLASLISLRCARHWTDANDISSLAAQGSQTRANDTPPYATSTAQEPSASGSVTQYTAAAGIPGDASVPGADANDISSLAAQESQTHANDTPPNNTTTAAIASPLPSEGKDPVPRKGRGSVPGEGRGPVPGAPPAGPDAPHRDSMPCLACHGDGEDHSATRDWEGEAVLAGVVQEGERFAFCMCNPPFFDDMASAGANPRTACGGTSAEMVYPGGEAAFIRKIVRDSLALRGRVHWYTTMVGRKVNLKALCQEISALGVPAVRTTEFAQGRTSRWGLAWSFSPLTRPPPRELLRPAPGVPQARGRPSGELSRPTSLWYTGGGPEKLPSGKLQLSGMEQGRSGGAQAVPVLNFTLEGVGRHVGAHGVLKATRRVLSELPSAVPGTCKNDEALFTVTAMLCLRALASPSGTSVGTVTGGGLDRRVDASRGAEGTASEEYCRVVFSVMQHAPGCVQLSSRFLGASFGSIEGLGKGPGKGVSGKGKGRVELSADGAHALSCIFADVESKVRRAVIGLTKTAKK